MGSEENKGEGFVRIAGSESTRLHFSGPPQALTGVIPLVNTSSEKQRIRGIAVKSEKLRGVGGVPLEEIPFRVRLRAGQQANLVARLPLDSRTAPGHYDFQVTMGGRTLSATAYVPEVVDLRVEPSVITIVASSKTTSYTKTVVCKNFGNVVLLSGTECKVPIFKSDPLIRTILDGLSKGDRKSAESMTLAALNELADLKVGTLVIQRKAMSLSPGEMVAAELNFVVPVDELEPQRQYSVPVALYNATLLVELYTTSRPENPPKTAPMVPKPKSKAPKSKKPNL